MGPSIQNNAPAVQVQFLLLIMNQTKHKKLNNFLLYQNLIGKWVHSPNTHEPASSTRFFPSNYILASPRYLKFKREDSNMRKSLITILSHPQQRKLIQ